MKNLLKPLLAATILSLTLGSVAMAKPEQGRDQSHHCMKKKGHHANGMKSSHQLRFLRGIDLTDAQKDNVFALTHAEVPKQREHMKARRALKKELMALSDNYSETKVTDIANKLGNLERDSVLARARHHQKVLSLLTVAQRKQVAENKAKFKEHRQRGFHDTKDKVSTRSHQDHSHKRAI